MLITPPLANEDFGFFNTYISLVDRDKDLVTALNKTMEVLEQLILTLDEDQLLYRYEPGKWNIKETIQHLIDAERNFCYRAMRISRGDGIQVPPLDVYNFVMTSGASEREIVSLMDELDATRQASITFFSEMPGQLLDVKGLARDTVMSVRALAFAMVGHMTHHTNLICERYLAMNN